MLISIFSGTRRGRPPRLRTQSITELLRPNCRPDLATRVQEEPGGCQRREYTHGSGALEGARKVPTSVTQDDGEGGSVPSPQGVQTPSCMQQ